LFLTGGVKVDPIDLGNDQWNKRVVYSPHVYGPDLYMQGYFDAPDFPKNMPAVWDQQWGFATSTTGRAVVGK